MPHLARVYVLNWKRYWATVRTCKLYDYANHHWIDFKGRVTAAPVFPETPSRGRLKNPGSLSGPGLKSQGGSVIHSPCE